MKTSKRKRSAKAQPVIEAVGADVLAAEMPVAVELSPAAVEALIVEPATESEAVTTEAVTEFAGEQTIEGVAEPVVDVAVESAADVSIEQAAEAAVEPVIESVVDESAAESVVAESAADVSIEQAAEAAVEPVIESVVDESAAEPVVAESAADVSIEQAAEAAVEPVIESVVDESAAETVVAESAADVSIEQVAQIAAEMAVESAEAESVVAEAAAEQVAEAAAEPVVVGDPIVVLGSNCSVKDAAALKTSLSAFSKHSDAVILDVSAVERVDTATMQLLCAFVRDRSGRNQSVTWRGESQALQDAVRLLGVGALLGLETKGVAA